MDRPHFFIPTSKTANETVRKGSGGTTFVRENYSSHGRRIYGEISQLRTALETKKDIVYSTNVYSKIQAPDNVPLKAIKSSLEHLGIHVTSIDPLNESKGIVSIKKNEFSELNEKIRNYTSDPKNPLKSYLKYIESLSPVASEDKFRFQNLDSENNSIDTILNLHEEANEEKMDLIIGLLKSEYQVEAHKIQKLVFDDLFCAISISTEVEKIINISDTFNLIQSVELNPPSIITQSIPSIEITQQLNVVYDSENPSVIIIDSGVSLSGIMQNCVVHSAQSLPEGATVPEYNHGTFVASRVSFGDELDRIVASGNVQSYCNIIDVAVFGVTTDLDGVERIIGPNRTQLSEILNAVAKAYKGQARVINLSLGENTPIDDYNYSLSAYSIDALSREFDLLFIIASGNIRTSLGEFPGDHFISPQARICSPAESVLGLTVGAYAKYSDPGSLSRNNQLSPFSRRGPGVNAALKPELVHHGGNLMSNYAPFARISASGLFHSGRHLATDNGTSFSAPIVSQIAARLFKYYTDKSVNLIKALLIHFTDIIDHHPVLGIGKEYQVGFGAPNYERAVNAVNHSASYLFEGKVKNDQFKILKFHIPAMLASENPESKLKIKITVVSNPPVNFRDPVNYVQSKVSIALDKLDASSNKKRVSFSADDKTEAFWSPIQQIEKTFTRSYSCGEWELRVRCWVRGKLDSEFEQDFAVVIEIIDELGGGDPYNSILNETGDTYVTRVIHIERAA
ncbi:MAG: S8 family peptidase [Crocinitomicaceae bacterium]|nr:S8 family peptidase [Crocinitomicaceae bacterium]MCF8433214.1 S8 family peptidase [Crocinitomicaceae bacterium]